MVGIHPEIMFHWLNINPQVKPVGQKQRALDTDRYKALQVPLKDRVHQRIVLPWLANQPSISR